MIRTFARYWVGMLAMMAFLIVFAAPAWVMATVIDHVTDNLWVGFTILILAISVQIAALMTWFSTAPGRRVIAWLSSIVFEHNKAA